MSPKPRRSPSERGFALVITLSLMVLLTIVAVGLLTLGSISLRSAGAGDAQAQAYANARMAVMMAIGQLQKQAGDDRRITADASISDNAKQGHMVGTWNSWTPDFAKDPTKATVQYGTPKTASSTMDPLTKREVGFRGWMISNPDIAALKERTWADGPPAQNAVKLYTTQQNGFDLQAPPVPLKDGTVAWAVVQENTKAKVNVGGPDNMKDLASNTALQVQRRPSLHSAEGLKAADSGFNLRANKVLSSNQVELDEDLAGGGSLDNLDASYTVHAQGLLTDAARGGLKGDMSLGFEMSETEFKKDSWDGVANPFRKGGFKGTFAIPASYAGQVPLFRPLIENPIIPYYFSFDPASVNNKFNAAGVPTYDHLRSFYRLPHYMYGSAGVPTVAERSPDHVAAKGANSGTQLAPAKSLTGTRSVTGIKPVLNRVAYMLSLALGGDNEVRLVVAPVVSLWNPYNTALEIDGAVAYPWIDVPFSLDWTITKAGQTTPKNYHGIAMSLMMGYQFEGQNHGRQVNPYFLCQMTSTGTNNMSKPIRFEPGEIRVFALANTQPREFNRRDDTATSKALWMRPVDDVNQFNTKGGLLVPMKNGIGGHGFTEVISTGDRVRLRVRDNGPGSYHYFVSLEDAGRIRQPVSLGTPGGQAIAEIQMCGFLSESTKTGGNPESPDRTYEELKAGGVVPFGVLETYQRCTLPGIVTNLISDVAYSMNPRQTYLTHYLSPGAVAQQQGTNKGAPDWVSTLRVVPSFDGAIQTTLDGRRSYWGASHQKPQGRDILPFFELPREPMLSLASFQHMDMASSAYSSANQFGNSWASPWLQRRQAAVRNQAYVSTGVPVYDTSYLTNEALWDSFFFSGAAPQMGVGSTPGSLRTAYDGDGFAPEKLSLQTVVQKFVEDPAKNPLGNPRMRLHKGGSTDSDLIKLLQSPAGCAEIAAHLTLDGAFNINSTDVNAWAAVLSGLRGEQFEGQDSTATSPSGETAFPRFRHPTGKLNDNWNGFRTLNDQQIKILAAGIVDQVKKRGPFLSLGEFVNRRIENSDMGMSGAIQSAIDAAKFNEPAKQAMLPAGLFPNDSAAQRNGKDTGVGIPGYLTQADVLQSLAPVITVRSDTFTIRGYGEAKDGKGNVIARAWCEAVVQRMPDFVDKKSNPAHSPVASLNIVNQTFGRRFEIVSIRRIPQPEIQAKASA